MQKFFTRITFMKGNREPSMTIVKTRQSSQVVTGGSRGILRLPPEGVRVSRHNPSSPLACFVASYWRVSWDLRGGQPHLQETLPHPNVYLVFENNRLQLSGVSTTKFTRTLAGQGFVFGVKFRPGGFRPFLKPNVSSLTNRILAANCVFGPGGDRLQAALLSCRDEDEMVKTIDGFLLRRTPEPDTNVALVDGLVGQILDQPDIRTVDDLVNRTGTGKRTLQRLFREYVGVPPKWVIQRYRLHELVARVEAGDPLDWPDLAIELGYFDQAHLIHDFRAITGYSPAGYQRR
jgi:AraC-like DNA-binding protein